MNTELKTLTYENKLYYDPRVQEFIKQIPIKKNFKGSNKGTLFDIFWSTIDWRLVELNVGRLQHNIFLNHTLCRKLQQEMLESPLAKLLAIKRVAFSNKGRKSAGVDGFCKLTRCGGIMLALNLKLDGSARTIRRVWIPKPNSTEKRPLGVPVIRDKAKQALVKLAIEPQWEARFGSRVFGFRPGRNCHDAVWNVRNNLRTGPKYIYDADISKCFDNISHNYLMSQLGFPELDPISLQIRAWLRAGILDPQENNTLFPEEGTAQGGVISPLLCNIALHGMESYVIEKLKRDNVKYIYTSKVKIYTYADDFVLVCDHKRTLFMCINYIKEFLTPIGLDIKASKTRKIHTLNRHITYTLNLISHIDEIGRYVFDSSLTFLPVIYGKPYSLPTITNSFNFLGYTFKCFSVGLRHQSGINSRKSSPLQIWVVPSTNSIRKHFSTIRNRIRKCNNPLVLVKNITPIIRGWLNYFSISDLRTANGVGLLRTRMNMILLNWQYKRLRTRKRISKVWIKILNDKWRFFADDQITGKRLVLPCHSDPSYSIVNYKPIRGQSSIYDGDIGYWSIRLKSVLGLTPIKTKILAKQKGCCHVCSKSFTPFDEVEVIKVSNQKTKTTGKLNKREAYRIVHKQCPLITNN